MSRCNKPIGLVFDISVKGNRKFAVGERGERARAVVRPENTEGRTRYVGVQGRMPLIKLSAQRVDPCPEMTEAFRRILWGQSSDRKSGPKSGDKPSAATGPEASSKPSTIGGPRTGVKNKAPEVHDSTNRIFPAGVKTENDVEPVDG